jgi:RNA polymerase sigma-70 factor (ECF subfamily)
MRAVVILREYEGMDYAQIAEIAGCSVGTVKSRLARAREELRKRLKPLVEEDQ